MDETVAALAHLEIQNISPSPGTFIFKKPLRIYIHQYGKDRHTLNAIINIT